MEKNKEKKKQRLDDITRLCKHYTPSKHAEFKEALEELADKYDVLYSTVFKDVGSIMAKVNPRYWGPYKELCQIARVRGAKQVFNPSFHKKKEENPDNKLPPVSTYVDVNEEANRVVGNRSIDDKF